jgi:hypothetical protein
MWFPYLIYAMFFGYGGWLIITGVGWTREGIRVEGPRARFGGFILVCLGGLIALSVERPDLQLKLMPILCLFPISGMLLSRILFGPYDPCRRC